VDVEHQPTDLAVGGSNPSRRAPNLLVSALGLGLRGPVGTRTATKLRPRWRAHWRALPTGLRPPGPRRASFLLVSAAEVAGEVRLVRAAEAERSRHEHARDAALACVDPAGLAASLPGLGPVGTAQLVATMGRPGRFPNGGAFKAFTGLVPRANETGQTDRKHQPMTKAGPRALRSQLVQSANTARKLDPQLAAVYHAQMTERGATHRKALCVVAARLAERGWLTMARGEPYVVCDLEGRPVTTEQAKRMIAERFTVTAEVRRRRRSSKKAGKAPHMALEAQGKSQREAGHEATFPAPA
jgi:hypothetical protein